MSDSLEQAIRGGMQVQDAARRAALDAGAARLGWKAGFGTAAAMANLGTAGPLVGFLTDATLLPSGSEIDVEGWGKAVLETEVAVRLGADVEAGGSAEDVAGAVDAIAAAIELVDLAELSGDPEAILAANSFHRAVLLGEFAPLTGALDEVRIDVRVAGGDEILAADPADVLGALAEVVVGMAEVLAHSDDGLRSVT